MVPFFPVEHGTHARFGLKNKEDGCYFRIYFSYTSLWLQIKEKLSQLTLVLNHGLGTFMEDDNN